MQTFEKIYNDNHENILRHINMRVNSPEIAEELTNDVFMKVHKHMGDYDETKSAVTTWVRFIAKNIIIDHFRCNRYANHRVSASDFNQDNGITEFEFVSEASADTDLERSELGQKIMSSFRSLKPKYRRVAVLYFMNQKQYKEIAEILDIPMGTVFGMISRCRAMLQNSLVAVR
jgi:RNA polymerase sigma-70 factor (ECF subfamily)